MSKRIISFLLALALALAATGMCAVAEETRDTIRILRPALSYDINSDVVAQMLEKETGCHVEYEYYSDDKTLALTISGGTDFDMIIVGASMYQTLVAQNAVKDIAPLLEELPEITEIINEKGWIYVAGPNGQIYGIPQVDDAVYTGGIGYRKDILADAGLSAEVETVDEFYTLLSDLKEQTGLIPLTGSAAVEAVIASGFGLSYDFVVDPETDEIVSWLRQDGMKEYLAWMHNAYEEGLIDVDWPVNKSDSINTKMSTGAAVMTYAAHWSPLNWVNALVEGGDEDAYFGQIVPLADPDGKRHIPVSNGITRITIIPATCSDERAELALRMVAARLAAPIYWIFNDGYEGTHYYFDENGYPIPIQPIFNDDMKNGSEFQIGRNQFVHPFSWMARVHKTQIQWDAFYDANSQAAAYGFEGRPLTFASFPEYAEYSSALGAMCNDYFLQVIAGTESLDSYDAFVAEWEAAGGLVLEQAATEWYHAHPELVESARNSYSPYAEMFGYVIG